MSPPASTPDEAPSSTPLAGAIQLRLSPAGLGCDAMPVEYGSVTFRIDPAATEQVSAVSDQGTVLRTYWSAGFTGGSAADPVVRDPAGKLIAADGDVLTIPKDAWPRIHGYFVCPSQDALYILLADPS